MASSHLTIPPYHQIQLRPQQHSDSSLGLSGELYRVTEKNVFASLMESLSLIHI